MATNPLDPKRLAALPEPITVERVCEAVERHHASLDNPGMCIFCGCDAEGVEPDAERYECESCEMPGVYGVEQLLIYLA
jgi:hypothetical protein